MSKQIKVRLAPMQWLVEDLLTTILDATPEELPKLHNKLTGLALAISSRASELKL